MRLQRITLNYAGYLESFTAKHPCFESLGYRRQYETLMADTFGWADFLSRNLVPRGWEVWEPVTNFEVHQKTWARENSVSWTDRGWFHEIASAQIKRFRPDILFVDSFTAFDAEFLATVRAEVPNLRCVVGWCGAPPPDYRIFRAFDLTLSNIPSLVGDLRAQGALAELLPHSFETSVLGLTRGIADSRPVNFSFTGSIFDGSDHHGERLCLLAGLCMSTNLEIYADFLPPKFWSFVRSLVDEPSVSLCKRFADKARVARRCKEAVYGAEMYQLLARSKITFNNHIGLSHGHASNTRLFQATGCGACLLTDWKPDLARYFEPDVEVVTYRCPEEAAEKVTYLLEHEDTRRKIAKAGQKRTLGDHTFSARTDALTEVLARYL